MSYLRVAINKIITQIIILLLLYIVCRALFYAFNHDVIGPLSAAQWYQVLIGGFRFDLSAIAFLNSFWILLVLIFANRKTGTLVNRIIALFFLIPNTFALLFEVSDWVYFRFNRKRATIEVFDLILTKGDFISILPGYLVSFWYVPLLALLLGAGLWYSHRKLNRYFAEKIAVFRALNFPTHTQKKYIPVKVLFLALVGGMAVLAMRGGLQLVPINARNAIAYLPADKTGLVLNTPFSIITSVESGRLKEYQFMSDVEADAIIRPIKTYHTDKPFRKKNVVIIILESFSRVFTGLGTEKSYTPFLDSLSHKSIAFKQAYANGLRSNEGIPAVLSGIPSMMEGPIITSVYSNNKFTAIAEILQEEGYQTAFFHGSTNGSMGFDTYAKNAGFQQYFGRTEYAGEKDYDGTWGIYDEPFLQYAITQFSLLKQPFMTAVFTLSSHPPFAIPAKYKNRFPKGPLGVEESIGYADFALQQFFASATRQAWYANTVFVLTADHCAPFGSGYFYTDGLGRYQVPILIFDPEQEAQARYDSTLVQQIDILPTVLDYLHYPKPFFAMGNSMIDTTGTRAFITFLSGNYNSIVQQIHLKTVDTEIKEAYHFPADITDQFNLMNNGLQNDSLKAAERYTKAFIQLFNHSVIHNQMHRSTYPTNMAK
ncbi:hypothetical protein DBR32_08175 [Taibaiella sp. KBW10]|uniref:LTA synthase family protein n=1 Tax=Taibaiella sp. KBW10 TaxID=2153357 RepID=UPI000F5A4EE5|nr:LTA synthase family protein [Taibaiella sp. KBW10]RQO30697.1 hypothetical protein DBR32_08175 [Taibaiella sp. KBW10]